MNKLPKKLLAVFLSVLMAVSSNAFGISAFASDKSKKDYVDGEVIAVLEDGASSKTSYGKNINVKNKHTFKSKKKKPLNVVVLKSKKLSTKSMIKKLNKNDKIKYAFPNYKLHKTDITNDTYSSYQWALDNTGQNGGTIGDDVNADALWNKASKSDEEQIVAVADTGLDLDNPEFKGKIWTNTHGSKLVGKHGYDFSGVNEDGEPRDGDGHGTHCAGIIAGAADNSSGISGINKSNVKIMPVKWLNDEGEGQTDDVLAAYDYISRAIDLGENVVAINNSWGGTGDSQEMEAFNEVFDMFGEKGAISVIAAGNESSDISEPALSDGFLFDDSDSSEMYTVPACTTSEYALVVAASNEKDELADFSNYSEEYVDVTAPGVDILSTVSYNCFNPGIYDQSKKSKLVDKMQDYNSAIDKNSFGYPTVTNFSSDDSDYEEENTDNQSQSAKISQTAPGFGKETGKALTISFEDTDTYAVEIPFKISDESKPYSVSFMASGKEDSNFQVYDVPSDTDLSDVEDSEYATIIGGSETGNYWSHEFFTSNAVDDDGDSIDSSYIQSTDRKLVIIGSASEDGATLNIDDLGISKQNVNEDEFEKYDYYCGTSMAAPYVAGAVALLRNAYSADDYDIYDIINIIKNTGRTSASLEGKTENAKVLSLDKTTNVPPMIFNAGYTEDGDIAIDGSFKNDVSVKVDDSKARVISESSSQIIIPDNNYNTRKVTITVSNSYGEDSYETLLSNKDYYPSADDIDGGPSSPADGFMLPANEELYYVSKTGTIGRLYYDKRKASYVYNEDLSVDLSDFFTSSGNASIESAVYTDSKIYFTAVNTVEATNHTIIGYDSCLACVDLKEEETSWLCDIPDETVKGGSLGVYNKSVYLIGGYSSGEFSTNIYKYNKSQEELVKQSSSLPEGRAYSKFIQYKDKLYGIYGADESEEMPDIISFDGKRWSTSSANLDSEDYTYYDFGNSDGICVYEGSLGYGDNGIFCIGSYVYGYGDSFIYLPGNDSLKAFKYSGKSSLEDPKVIGTSIPGAFVGFCVQQSSDDESDISLYKKILRSDYDDDGYYYDDDYDYDYDDEDGEYTFLKVSMTTSYAVNGSSNYNYGEMPDQGKTPSNNSGSNNSSKNNGGANNSGTKNSAAPEAKNTAAKKPTAASVKKSAASALPVLKKVKSLKAVRKGKKAKLSWKKVNGASGYQIQQYKNGKWKTVKKIKSQKKVKYTVKKLKKNKTYKFRVRAYGKSGSKTYYGKWSKVAKVKIK